LFGAIHSSRQNFSSWYASCFENYLEKYCADRALQRVVRGNVFYFSRALNVATNWAISFSSSWQHAWSALGLHADDALREQLLARYAEPLRKYHTQQHLYECITQLAPALPQAAHPGEVELALWFHDAVYELTAKDNELQSAQWAQRALLAAGAGAACAQRVYSLVMATQHSAAPGAGDAQLLVDVDLSILGAPAARFDEYERQVRDEYAHVPEAVFRSKRCAVLQSFLARPCIYNTAYFQNALEQRARDNLQRSVAQLQT
jgi:predicted metal-dependent HD superfamily phosphohydrolase